MVSDRAEGAILQGELGLAEALYFMKSHRNPTVV